MVTAVLDALSAPAGAEDTRTQGQRCHDALQEAGSLPAGVWLKDLGLHRLKDGGRPEQIFQLQAEGLPAVFPPLRSVDNPTLRHNLPAQVSSFIGREAELAEVRRLVGGSRLVTLTGAGGAGKTRLALQVAAGLADGTGDGVWFADLAPLGDPGLVAVTVADVLGVRREPGRPVLEAVVQAVGGRSLLVLLDNCEHVLGACAKLADALLRGCPNLALLATSREPLGIGGERLYRVPSMGTPADGADAAAIRASEAVRLLEDRAAAQGVPLGWDAGHGGGRPDLPAAGWHPAADPGWSARLHGAADQALADLGHALEPLEERLADLDRQRLRAAMGAEAFEAEYAAGRTLDLARAAHQAQQGIPAGREAQPAGALVSEPDAAVPGEAVTVLTPRELDVLKLVVQGLSNPDIARRLVLSEHTVHRHLANILRKLGLSSRAAAAAWGVRTGLV